MESLASRTDAKNQTLNYAYDLLDRLSSKSGAGLSVGYGYDGGTDGLGRRTSMADSAGSASYGYDPRGRLTSVTRVINGSSYRLGTTYDEQDRVLTSSYPNGDSLAYTYGDDGQPTTLALGGASLVGGASYNALGQPTSLALGNGLTTTWRYYALDQTPPQPNQWYGRLYSVQTGSIQNQTMTSYDAVGNLTGISYGDHTAEVFAAGYDEWDQLTSYGSLEGYSYIPSGQQYNLGSLQTKGADTLTYPAPGQPIPHAPSSVGPVGGPYSYDQNGNRGDNATYVYRYDAENHLVEVDDLGLPEIQNTYDGDGTRLVRTRPSGTTHSIGNWYEVDPATGVGTAYYPFNGRPAAVKQGSTLSYLHHDHLGSLVSATDASGAELGWARYLPFGGLRLSGGTLPSDRLFTGQTRDFTDQFYFFKSRYYDAGIGQFQSPDSLIPNLGKPGPLNAQTLNRYAYALNNPLREIDPTGHAVADPSGGGDGITSWFAPDWVRAFRAAHSGKDPTADDYAYRFISMVKANGLDAGETFVIPPGVDLDQNFAEMRRLAAFVAQANSPTTLSPEDSSGGQRMLYALAYFAGLVAPEGRWDYKAHFGIQYIGFGNFNYGAAGAALGISEDVLLRSGGAVQVSTDYWHVVQAIAQGVTHLSWPAFPSNPSLNPVAPFGGPPYGDVVGDRVTIMLGYEFYQAYEAAPRPATIPRGS